MTDRCPRCGAKRQGGTECPHCGVIYANAERRQQEKEAAMAAVARSVLVTNCRVCHGEISVNAPTCPHCGEVFQAARSRWPLRDLLGYGGAGLLALGVFLPMVRLPMLGTMNLFNNGHGKGLIILALAAASFAAVALRRHVALYGTGGASLAMLTHTLYTLNKIKNDARADFTKDLAGNPFAGLAEMAIEATQLQWGWAVLFAGAALLIVAAALPKAGRD